MSCRVICALVVLATSASGLQLSQQLPQLQSRRGWLANGIAVGAATLGAPKWTVADEGETATAEAAAAEATAVEPAAATPVAKDAEVDSLTKMLLERSEKNRAINADLVKKQSIQNGMGGVDGVCRDHPPLFKPRSTHAWSYGPTTHTSIPLSLPPPSPPRSGPGKPHKGAAEGRGRRWRHPG